MVDPCRKVVEMLEEKGVSAALINARFVKPIDVDLILKYARSTGCLVTVEEHSLSGGFGSAVLEALEERDALDGIRVKRIGIGDEIVEHGAPTIIRKKLKLDPQGLFGTIVSFYQTTIKKAVSTRNSKNGKNGKKNNHDDGKKNPSPTGKKNQLKVKQPIHG